MQGDSSRTSHRREMPEPQFAADARSVGGGRSGGATAARDSATAVVLGPPRPEVGAIPIV